MVTVLCAVLSSGCASTVLRERVNTQASTLPDLYYQQVLDNLAMSQANPARLPYFADPAVGRTGVHRTTIATYQLGWDFITGGAAAFLGRYLFDKQFAQVQGNQVLLGEWLPRSTDNPDKLLLMQYAYHKAIGLSVPEEEEFLHRYYYKTDGTPRSSQRYEHALHPGWFGVGGWKDVPRHACGVGHFGHTYVWVMPEHLHELSWFTLAILDIVTISPISSPSAAGEPPPLFVPRERSAGTAIIP